MLLLKEFEDELAAQVDAVREKITGISLTTLTEETASTR